MPELAGGSEPGGPGLRGPEPGAPTRTAWLHGYTMDSTIWQDLWALLPGIEHVGVDLPGHGTAADTPMPAGLPALATAVADRLREEGCRRLVALSFGSCVALQVALDHPDVLDALVLAAPTLSGVPDDPAARAKYFLLYGTFRNSGPGPLMARQWMADPPGIFTGLREHQEPYERMAEVVGRHRFTELGTGAMGTMAHTVHTTEHLAALDLPVLVISGTQDMPQFRENARLLAQHAPRCQVVTIPGAGHLPLLEEPAGCADPLADFLTRGRVVVG